MMKWILVIVILNTGVWCIQASVSASLGGQQILDCELNFPGGKRVLYMISWKKEGLDTDVILFYDGYAPHYHKQFEGRVRLVNEIALEISHIQESDEGWYECEVTFIDGIDNKKSNGTWIYLNVYIPPKIISSSPASFHQPLSSDVRIYCRAAGSPKPTASWTKDGLPLYITSRISITNEGSVVLISDLKKQDGGIYKCTFQNSVGLIAQTVHLIVEGQAYIIGAPANKTAVLGQRVQFSCQARGYPTNITYRWYKDDFNINLLPSYGKRIMIQGDGSLVISIVEKEDMGWYLCRPSNGIGQDPEAVAFLNVSYKPEVLKDRMPRSLIWAMGFKEKLDCPVDANPPVYTTVWTKDGIVIGYDTTGRLSLLGNGTLVVDSVIMADTGNYRCTAQSTIGNGDSEIVQVEVKDPPKFILRPDAKYIRQPGQSVMIPCVATGTPNPTISWRRADGQVFDNRAQQRGGNLTITGLVKSDHGDYECEAQNEVRKIVTITKIIIQNTTPHAPYNVTVTTRAFDATVKWIPAYSSTLQYFNVWFRSVVNNIPDPQWEDLRVEPANTTRFTIYELHADTVYEFKVLSKNNLGNGQFSEVVRARTLGYKETDPDVPPTDGNGVTYFPPIERPIGIRPSIPVNVSAHLRDNFIYVSWDEPKSSPVKIFRYIVEYRTDNSPLWEQSNFIKAPESSYTLYPISSGISYSFRVVSYGIMAYSETSREVVISTPDEGFGLSNAEIGGIIGGLLFLVVAITLAVVAVVCNRRRDKQKKQTKFGNVKYVGPHDEIDVRPEYTSEWSDEPPPSLSRGFGQSGGNTLAYSRDNTLVGTDNGVFMLPKSGDPYSSFNQSYPSGDNSMYRDRDKLINSRDTIRSVRGVPYRGESSYWDDSRFPEYVNVSNYDRNSTINRSKHSIPFDNDINDDENGFRDTVRMRNNGSSAKNRSRSQPAFRHSDGPSYPVPERPRSRGHSMPRDPGNDHNYPERYGPQTQVPVRSPMFPQSQTPVLSPVVPNSFHGNQSSYQGDSTEDDVFALFPPMTNVPTGRPSFPRHSSMKPGTLQTYLTEDIDYSGRPLMPSDLSSVLPSPYTDTSSRQPYNPYQRQFDNNRSPLVAYGSQSRLPNASRNASYGEGENTVVAGRQHSPDRTFSHTLSREDSNESNGKPYSYTRDELFGTVDKVRRGLKQAQAQGQQPWVSGTDFADSSSMGGHHGAQIPESAKPSVIVRDHPSRGYSYEQDSSRGRNNSNRSRASGNSFGAGSLTGEPVSRVSGIVVLDHSRSAGREDLTPDSISSGIGSRNTSSQLTGSSLHSRPSRLGSGLTHDVSHDSAVPQTDYTVPLRKDISGDENYEFDSYNAVESDLIEALRNYSQVQNGNEELLSALQEGLCSNGLMSELYPKPTRQSRYKDSEQRFEKLRGELQQYRQKQQDESRSSNYQNSFSSSGREYPQYQPRTDSYSSTLSSRQSASTFQPVDRVGHFNPVMGDHSNYQPGPMDSDML